MQIDLSKPLEVKIHGKWRKCLGINYHTFEPTVDYIGEPGSGWRLNLQGEREHFIMASTCHGWSLDSVEGFRNA